MTQTPIYRVDSLQALARTPVTTPNGNASQMLGNLAMFRRDVSPKIVDHYNVQPVYRRVCGCGQARLGRCGERDPEDHGRTKRAAEDDAADAAGQGADHERIVPAAGLRDPFRDRAGLFADGGEFPILDRSVDHSDGDSGAFCGILWMLFMTQTTFSVPSLMGAIMAIGVATANSILLVTFANDERLAGKDQREAALSAGHTRLRPVMMTALAMIIGMLPMSLGLGEGGEQNAPLGRAVIGGLLFATVATLFLVPTIYSLLKKHAPIDYSKEIEDEAIPAVAGRKAQEQTA